MEDKKISVEKVFDILNWAEYEGLLKGEIDTVKRNIWEEAEEEKA